MIVGAVVGRAGGAVVGSDLCDERLVGVGFDDSGAPDLDDIAHVRRVHQKERTRRIGLQITELLTMSDQREPDHALVIEKPHRGRLQQTVGCDGRDDTPKRLADQLDMGIGNREHKEPQGVVGFVR